MHICVCYVAMSRCNGVYIEAAYYREKILPEKIDIAPDDARARARARGRANTHTHVNVTPMHVYTPPPAPPPPPRPVVAADVYTPIHRHVSHIPSKRFSMHHFSPARASARLAVHRENVEGSRGGQEEEVEAEVERSAHNRD